jgi:hypothetical protein
VDSGRRIARVQVKTTHSPDGRKYTFCVSRSGNKESYGSKSIDYFALVCLDLDIVYIVPVSELKTNKTAKVWPTVKDSAGRLEQFREAWQLLRTDVTR